MTLQQLLLRSHTELLLFISLLLFKGFFNYKSFIISLELLLSHLKSYNQENHLYNQGKLVFSLVWNYFRICWIYDYYKKKKKKKKKKALQPKTFKMCNINGFVEK